MGTFMELLVMLEEVNDRTQVKIYMGGCFNNRERYFICCGNWYQDRILLYSDYNVKYFGFDYAENELHVLLYPREI